MFDRPAGMYMGLNVYLWDGGNLSPRRRHSRKANQGKASYHRRIQKKWTKRFGSKWVETQKRGEVLLVGNWAMVVRRDDWQNIGIGVA